MTTTMEVRIGDIPIDAEVTYSISKYTPAKRCDNDTSEPSEGGEVEIEKAILLTTDYKGNPVSVDLLPILLSREVARLQRVLFENEVLA